MASTTANPQIYRNTGSTPHDFTYILFLIQFHLHFTRQIESIGGGGNGEGEMGRGKWGAMKRNCTYLLNAPLDGATGTDLGVTSTTTGTSTGSTGIKRGVGFEGVVDALGAEAGAAPTAGDDAGDADDAPDDDDDDDDRRKGRRKNRRFSFTLPLLLAFA